MIGYIQKRSPLLGGILWLAWVLAIRPHPLHTDWGVGLLLLAALVVVPLATGVLLRSSPFSMSVILRLVQRCQLPSAIALAVSFSIKNSWLTLALALPWTGVLVSMAIVGVMQLWRTNWSNVRVFGLSSGLAYLAVAAGWLVMDRAGLAPLGFSPDIVFLTIVHFHYAGFVLPVLAGLAALQLGNRPFDQIWCYFVVAGVGLLALGITFTQLGLGPDWEMASAWLMALSAVGVALMHVRLFFLKQKPLKVRVLWVIAGFSLLLGMLLAGLYGSRFIAPVAWLDIPMMRALHGSLNGIGLGVFGVLGWWKSLNPA